MKQFRVTVATVVEREGLFLMVEERDKQTLQLVYNQPAGHVELGESLIAAAKREALEETGSLVEPTGVLSVGLYRPQSRPETYCRVTLIAQWQKQDLGASLDPDIHRVVWLSYEQILAESAKLRSPMVLDSIERYRRGESYPLSMLTYYES